MTEQLTLDFDDSDSAIQTLKEISVEEARRGANKDWFAHAMRGVRVLAKRQQYVCSDDVWQWLRPLELSTPEPRAMGAVMSNSYRDSVITPTTDWRVSERPACHGRPIRLWKSLTYETCPEDEA